jgi:uroporphyrinogen decarboxylase
MEPKERVRAVLNRQPVDRFPGDHWVTPEISGQLKSHYGVEEDYDLYDAMGLDKIVWIFPMYRKPGSDEGSGSQVGADTSGEHTMWGVPLVKMQSGQAVYYEFGRPPLKDYESPQQLDEYSLWPDPDYFDYETAQKDARKASARYATLGPWVSFFEVYCQMRGMEQALMDLLTEPRFAHAVLDRIEDCQTEMMKRFIRALGNDLDMIFLSDDMAMQQNLLISKEIWSQYFRPRLKRWCDLIHSFGKKVFYHSDGAVEPLIGELIDCGIDVLNPIQHACPGMELEKLADRYGSRLVFHGGVDNQTVLPFGTVKQVQEETKHCLETLGANGTGYIVCSCHNVQAGTPIDNIIAMIETVKSQ